MRTAFYSVYSQFSINVYKLMTATVIIVKKFGFEVDISRV